MRLRAFLHSEQKSSFRVTSSTLPKGVRLDGSLDGETGLGSSRLQTFRDKVRGRLAGFHGGRVLLVSS